MTSHDTTCWGVQAMHGPTALSLLPSDQQQLQELEHINSWVYESISNGAYKAGFASAQTAYEAAYRAFFEALDRAELLLSKRRSATGLPAVLLIAIRVCLSFSVSGETTRTAYCAM